MPNKCNTILHKEVTINDLDDSILIDLLDGWPGSRSSTWRSSTSSWHTSRHSSHVRHASGSSSRLIQLGDNWVADTLDLLLLVLELLDLGELVSVEPLDGLVTLLGDLFLVVLGDLVGDLLVLDGSLHVEAVAFKTVLGRNSVLLLVVLVLELLGVVDHPLNLFLGETSLVVGDGDLVLLAGGFVAGRYVQDTVGVDVKGDLNLRNTSWCGWDAGKVEFSKEMVVLGHGSLTLVDLDGDGGLVVAVGGEGLGLLGWNGGVPLDQAGHDSTSCLNTKRQWSNIEKQKVRDGLTGVSCEDGSLDSSSISNSFIRVDGLVQLLAVEEVLEQLLDLRDSGRSSNKDDVVDGTLVHLGISHGLLHGLEGSLEEVRAEFLKPSSGD